MQTRSKTDPALVQAVESLAKSFSRVSLDEFEQQNATLERFKDLQTRLSQAEERGLAGLATMGAKLLEHLSKHAVMGPGDIRDMLQEVVRQLHTALAWEETTRPSPNQVVKAAMAAVQSDESSLRLALCDGQRLGELLVTMAMLKPAQVQEALDVQKKTGVKLGDALVQMNLLTADMVQSALRVQKQRRMNSGDVWSLHRTNFTPK